MVLFLKSLLCCFYGTDCWLFNFLPRRKTVFRRFICSRFLSLLFFRAPSLKFWSFFAIVFPSAIFLHTVELFGISVLCDQLFLFPLTPLRRMACWHISHVAPETDSNQSVTQTAVAPWQFFGACEVYTTGSCHNQDITLKNFFLWSLRACPLGQQDQTIVVGFPLQKNNL